MGENIFSPEEMQRLSIIATEAHQLSAISRSDIEDSRVGQEQLIGYTYSETESLSEEVGKLSEFVGLMFNILGVPIRDSDGKLRDCADVSHDLRSLNPKIIMSFQELMQF